MAFAEPLFDASPPALRPARPRPGLAGVRGGGALAPARPDEGGGGLPAELAARVRPVVLAGERRLAVPGPLGDLLPRGGLQRGSVVRVEGAPGSGATSLVLSLLAAATAAG
ncbi:MAG TPA: hypothetical protein VGQ80_01705, partial [Acidimicrobiia bacterium]|nr:hypothetical protein [Acidimicrobiia bacterium]